MPGHAELGIGGSLCFVNCFLQSIKEKRWLVAWGAHRVAHLWVVSRSLLCSPEEQSWSPREQPWHRGTVGLGRAGTRRKRMWAAALHRCAEMGEDGPIRGCSAAPMPTPITWVRGLSPACCWMPAPSAPHLWLQSLLPQPGMDQPPLEPHLTAAPHALLAPLALTQWVFMGHSPTAFTTQPLGSPLHGTLCRLSGWPPALAPCWLAAARAGTFLEMNLCPLPVSPQLWHPHYPAGTGQDCRAGSIPWSQHHFGAARQRGPMQTGGCSEA